MPFFIHTALLRNGCFVHPCCTGTIRYVLCFQLLLDLFHLRGTRSSSQRLDHSEFKKQLCAISWNSYICSRQYEFLYCCPGYLTVPFVRDSYWAYPTWIPLPNQHRIKYHKLLLYFMELSYNRLSLALLYCTFIGLQTRYVQVLDTSSFHPPQSLSWTCL